jgi:hypothetical protein
VSSIVECGTCDAAAERQLLLKVVMIRQAETATEAAVAAAG